MRELNEEENNQELNNEEDIMIELTQEEMEKTGGACMSRRTVCRSIYMKLNQHYGIYDLLSHQFASSNIYSDDNIKLVDFKKNWGANLWFNYKGRDCMYWSKVSEGDGIIKSGVIANYVVTFQVTGSVKGDNTTIKLRVNIRG